MKPTKRQSQDRQEAIEYLREILKPGMTIHTINRHTSRSGMLRIIDPILLPQPGGPAHISHLGPLAARALGEKYDDRQGIPMGGCGTDMGFELVYTLSRTLFADGFTCPGERCGSCDHSNGTYTPHHHHDGGYALAQRWL